MHRICWLTLSFLIVTIVSFGQLSFRNGYFIDNDGKKTQCLIKDNDWKNSPQFFNYKFDETGTVEKMETKDVKEFLAGDTKYIRIKGRYDQSTQELKKLGLLASPDWVETDNLMLRVLVEGKANLYQYTDPDHVLFFYNVDGGPIEQLIYKNYMKPDDVNMMATNKMYLAQINSQVRCDRGLVNDQQVPYIRRPLVKYFEQFNICSGDAVKAKPKKQKAFSIRLTPGIDFTTASAERISYNNYDFGSNNSFRMGAEFQFTLPFNRNKWAFIVEPTYQQFHSKKEYGLDYTGIEMPLGVRHRFFLSEKANIFINAMGLVDYTIKHEQKFINSVYKIKALSLGGAFGAGFAYGRFSVEGRYYPTRERTDGGSFNYKYTKSTIILGVRVF